MQYPIIVAVIADGGVTVVMDASLQTIGRRYVLHEQLGAGGMGAVYRATDRLTGEAVALRRVTTPAE